ncbi:hypothetical protein KAR91_44895 [Candidatus Pacearchaeota archaeon]|nr:hypothetical protein [Candidatus Pacearchaeota archaeon]
MKIEIPATKEVDIKYITIEIAVRYEEEDIPNDAPMRHGDMWKASVDIDTGKIDKWPQGQTLDLYMKVCDEGMYRLFDTDWNELACVDGYVPHGIVPGSYGDYVELKINEFGVITNWPTKPVFDDFWPQGE